MTKKKILETKVISLEAISYVSENSTLLEIIIYGELRDMGSNYPFFLLMIVIESYTAKLLFKILFRILLIIANESQNKNERYGNEVTLYKYHISLDYTTFEKRMIWSSLIKSGCGSELKRGGPPRVYSWHMLVCIERTLTHAEAWHGTKP